jgi:hypothetical protein
MGKTAEQLIQIVTAGGGVIIDGSQTINELVQIAAAASGSGATVIIKNAGAQTTRRLTEISAAGRGNVILDLSQ